MVGAGSPHSGQRTGRRLMPHRPRFRTVSRTARTRPAANTSVITMATIAAITTTRSSPIPEALRGGRCATDRPGYPNAMRRPLALAALCLAAAGAFGWLALRGGEEAWPEIERMNVVTGQSIGYVPIHDQ